MDNGNIELTRQKILNETLLAFAILGIPTVISSLFRTISFGWSFLFTWHILLITLLWCLYLFKDALTIQVKVFSLVTLSLVTGLLGAWEWGLPGGWQIIIIAAPILVTIFYGKKQGLLLIGLSALLLSLIALIYISSPPDQEDVVHLANQSVYFWINSILTLVFLMSPLIISIGKTQQLLFHTINKLTDRSLELDTTQKELSAIFDFLPIPILILSGDQILRTNAKFTEILGYQKDDLKEVKDWMKKAFPNTEYHSEANLLWNKSIQKATKNQGSLEPAIFNVTSKDQVELKLEIYFKSYENRIMVVFNDLSLHFQNQAEIKRNEELLRKQNDDLIRLNQELLTSNDQITEMNQKLLHSKKKAEESDKHKTEFLQNMSHEIRTPLNAVIGFTEMLKEGDDLDKAQHDSYLDIILKSGNQLLSVVNDIISLSSIETGNVIIHEERINVNQLLVELSSLYKIKSEETNIPVSIHSSLEDEAAYTLVDVTKLKQVLINLISNAFKFTIKGKISIGYNLRSGFLVFYVKDTGIGIKTEFHQKIFERFSKGDEEMARKYSGTGLGLSISKSFVEMMGGRIWVLSEENKGATFFFTIPYRYVPPLSE